MTSNEFWLWLNNNLFCAGMNLEYHQTMAWRFWVAECAANMAVMILVIASIAIAARKTLARWSIPVSVVSAIVAAGLLVVPFASWRVQSERCAGEWSSIKGTLSGLEQDYHRIAKDKPISDSVQNEVRALEARKGQLQASEPAAWPKLLKECYGNQVERMHGPGIRTAEEARKNLEARGAVLDQPQRPAPAAG